jgi:hypothetical protein
VGDPARPPPPPHAKRKTCHTRGDVSFVFGIGAETDCPGIVVAYFPLITNEKVPDVDPEVSPYLSTWNFEVRVVVFCAKAGV